MMRGKFDEQLLQLNNLLIEMGTYVEEAISATSKALLEQDAVAANKIILGDEWVDDKEREIESLCLKLLLNQQPVASDLRQISTSLKIITDMERIGDQAADISELCIMLAASDTSSLLDQMHHLSVMAEETSHMVAGAIDAFVKKDLDLAEAVIAKDDTVDALFVMVRNDLISLVHDNVDKGEVAFDLLQVAKYYERIGDHAENIAEWVVFSLTGKHKDTQLL